jgi:hypothetical protein
MIELKINTNQYNHLDNNIEIFRELCFLESFNKNLGIFIISFQSNFFVEFFHYINLIKGLNLKDVGFAFDFVCNNGEITKDGKNITIFTKLLFSFTSFCDNSTDLYLMEFKYCCDNLFYFSLEEHIVNANIEDYNRLKQYLYRNRNLDTGN